MNPRCYADMLRVLEGTRLVAKSVASLAGNETAYTSSSVGRHLIEIGLQAQNAIYSRSNPTLYSSSNMEKNLPENHQDFTVSMHDNRANDTSKQTRLMPEYYIPNNAPVNSIIAPLSNPNNVIQPNAVESPTAKNSLIPSSLHQSNTNSFSDTDPTIHPTSNPIDTIDSYSSYSHIQEGRPVPSTRFGRAMGFASLGVGLMTGTAMEYASRFVQKRQDDGEDTSLVFNSSNSDRLAKTLCRMRGAALKLGQLLSIQDEDNLSLPTPLSKALQQVRQNAEAMPLYQLRQQLKKEWKDQYNEKDNLHVGLESMDTLPFAAASIGQVHRGVLKPDFLSSTNTRHTHRQHVVIKVQYPGVAESIESDLSNLQMLVSMTGVAPSGLFLDNIIRVGRQELKVECDYIQEAQNQKCFKEWIEQDEELQKQRFRVPAVIDTLSTKKILTSEYCPGSSIDIVSTQGDEKERNRIGRAILYLTMKELFCWRFMQTDPNWGNFLYDTKTRTTYLVRFHLPSSPRKKSFYFHLIVIVLFYIVLDKD
jgi:hypothetical protein